MRFLIKYSFITIFISIATAIYLLCCTTQGLIFDLQYIARLFPGTLKIEKISGTLFPGFSLQTVSYQTKEEKIILRSLTVSWRPKQLLHGKLAIDSLILEQPQITLFATNSTPNNLTLDDFKFLHRITINNLVIDQLSIRKADLQLDLTGQLRDKWDFHWQLRIPTLNALCINCAGSLIGSGSIIGERLIPTINANIHGNNLVIAQQTISNLNGEAHIVIQPKINSSINLIATHLNISNNLIKKIALTISGNIAYEKHNLIAQTQVALAQKQAMLLTAALPDFSGFTNPKQKITATIKLNFTELDGLRYFIPEIQHPRGTILGNLNVAGTALQPEVTGTVNLKQGHVAIHALGIHLNDMMIQATLDKSKIISLQGSLRSAKGTGQLQGNIDLNKPHFPIVLALQGKNLNAIHLPKFKVVISPDLKLSFIYPNLELQGRIVIAKAIIKLKNFISTVTLPDETVFVDQPQTETPAFLLATKLHLVVNLGNDVFFSYKDFETNLGGKLLIDQAPNSPATATGEIYAIKGKYTIYGQDLVIKTGRLIFAGNVLTNPGLNIEAIRKVKGVNAGNTGTTLMPSLENYTGTDTTVGVRIIGTVNNPQITLFSIPAGLTQAEILSSLGGEGAALMGALSILSPGASNIGGMTDKLTKMLGLTEVNIASVQTFNSTTNQMQSTPSFVVGKQISRKLSLHYSIGIFNPVSILNVRYQFNKHWAIQSETSTIDNGADILYGFERP